MTFEQLCKGHGLGLNSTNPWTRKTVDFARLAYQLGDSYGYTRCKVERGIKDSKENRVTKKNLNKTSKVLRPAKTGKVSRSAAVKAVKAVTMKTKEYKKALRIKVERLSKHINCAILTGFFLICWHFQIDGYIATALGVSLWLYIPDVVAYILEHYYKISHNRMTYR